MCLIIIFAVFVVFRSGKLENFWVNNALRLITSQNPPTIHTNNSDAAKVTSGALFPVQTNFDGHAASHSAPFAKMDKKNRATFFKLEPKPNVATWTPTYYPFVIQLGTFKTLEQVTRAVSIYTKKGLEVHWNPVDIKNKGRWYRIFTGYFKSKTEAVRVKRDYRLINSLIRFNPWTVLIGLIPKF